MGGYGYGQEEPTEKCPYCGHVCEADFVDVGIGYQQCGPYHCDNCRASEIGPHDAPRELTAREKETHWYGPESVPSEHANMLNGQFVSHRQMVAAYRDRFVGSKDWEDGELVRAWYEGHRRKSMGFPEEKPGDYDVPEPEEDAEPGNPPLGLLVAAAGGLGVAGAVADSRGHWVLALFLWALAGLVALVVFAVENRRNGELLDRMLPAVLVFTNGFAVWGQVWLHLRG